MKTIPHLLLWILPMLAFTSNLKAQESPFHIVPEAKPPYYRVRYEGSTQQGQLAFPVQYTIWIPENVGELQGVIVHQHGCGTGSCKSGLTGAFDLHWQALAKKHRCALLSPSYEQPQNANCQLWCDPRNGSDAAFQQGLVDLGKWSNHPELSKIPWALWGHSGGGHWAGGMALLHPDRVIGAWLRSGVPFLKANPERPDIEPYALRNEILTVPMMCNLGTKEGVSVKTGRFSKVWPANLAFFDPIRNRKGQIGVAVDPLTSHECGNQRYLAIPWFDACLKARLPDHPDENLRPVRGVSFDYEGRSIWLPSRKLKTLWGHYIKDTQVPDSTPPPSPTELSVEDHVLSWRAVADLESGLKHFIIERDGQAIAKVPDKPNHKFGRPLFQGLQYSDTPLQPLVQMTFTDPSPVEGKEHQYRVIAVNTAGLKSR